MGTSLNGLTPAGTYPGLIKTGDNAPIDGTLKTLSDGNGNNLPMAVSTTTINLTGTAQVGGVAIANTTQLAAKQDTLVSGTNIKTINGTSVLGSGDIVTPYTPPSGVAGAIQFSNGSAFASDAANLFWDDTNNRLNIGQNTGSRALNINDSLALYQSGTTTLQVAFHAESYGGRFASFGASQFVIPNSYNGVYSPTMNIGSMSSTTNLGATLGIKGSGSTSATTSLLVQNSAGSSALQVTDDRIVKTFNGLDLSGNILYANGVGNASIFGGTSWLFDTAATGTFRFRNGSMALGASVADATAHLDVQSTTKGFLPPRMTTTQKNAIATPAAGLMVYDTTLNQMSYFNSSSWVNF